MQRRYRTKITRKGQITLPAEMRRELGIDVGDVVEITVEDGRVLSLERAGNWAEQTAGIFKSSGPVLSEREMKVATEQAIADSVMERAAKTDRARLEPQLVREQPSEYGDE